MRYYIIHKGEIFTTNWFDRENFYVLGMTVIDTRKNKYYMGGNWIKIDEDSL